MHREPGTQRMHAVATTTALGLIGLGLARRQPLLIALAPIVDYAIAQASHRKIEGNTTKPWRHPLRHARAELRLWRLTLTGRVDAEVERVERAKPGA